MTSEYDRLEPNGANFVPLTPLSFLHRSADIYPQREALIYNQRRYSWAQTRNRCVRIASSLAARGIGKNDTVSVFAFNTPEMFESHFSVPMAGAVLNTINTRLDAETGQERHSLLIERVVNEKYPNPPFSVYRAERIVPYEAIALPEGLTRLTHSQ